MVYDPKRKKATSVAAPTITGPGVNVGGSRNTISNYADQYSQGMASTNPKGSVSNTKPKYASYADKDFEKRFSDYMGGWDKKQIQSFINAGNDVSDMRSAMENNSFADYYSNINWDGTPGPMADKPPSVTGPGVNVGESSPPPKPPEGYQGNANNTGPGQVQNTNGTQQQMAGQTQKKASDIQNFNPIDFEQYRTESATIEDIASKYGFDYSKDYAKTQAEAERQAKQNAYEDTRRRNESLKEENLQSIENNVMSATDSLDRNYFQQYMNQAQNQTNNGLNAGIANDQNLRLAMSRQAELGDVYRDANLGRMKENNRFTNEDLRLEEAIGLLDQWQKAYSDRLYNERRQQGFDNAMTLNEQNMTENLALLEGALSERGQNVNYATFLERLQENARQFDTNLEEQQRQFDTTEERMNELNPWQQAQMALEYYKYNNPSATDVMKDNQFYYSFDNASAGDELKADVELTTNANNNQTRLALGEMNNNTKLQIAQMQNDLRAMIHNTVSADKAAGLEQRTMEMLNGNERFLKTLQQNWARMGLNHKEFLMDYGLRKQNTTAGIVNTLGRLALDFNKFDRDTQQMLIDNGFKLKELGISEDQLNEIVRMNDHEVEMDEQNMSRDIATLMLEASAGGISDEKMKQILKEEGVTAEDVIAFTKNDPNLGYDEEAINELNSRMEALRGNNPKTNAGNENNASIDGLGSLSARYESNGNPGTIANNSGDIGGKSYGTYQLALNMGTPQRFISFLGTNYPDLAKTLGGNPGSSQFDSNWKSLAQSQPNKFEQAQHNFIKSSYYEPANERLINSIGLDTSQNPVLSDVLWSTAVQHGVGGAETVFRNALGNDWQGMTANEIVEAVYRERSANNGMKYFSSSSPNIRKGVLNRFHNEMQDALNRLDG